MEVLDEVEVNDEPVGEELLNEFDHGWFECNRWQTGMLTQLQRNLSAIRSGMGESGRSGKPKSKPPCNLGDMDLFL